MRQKMSNWLAPSSRAASSSSFGIERNWSVEIPHDDRQDEGDVDEDQHEVGVEQADVLRHEIDRQGQHDRADEAVGDEPEPEIRLAPEIVAREREGRRRAEHHGEQRAADGNDQRIDDRVDDLLVGEHIRVIGERRRKEPDGGRRQQIRLRLERRRHHPVKWKYRRREDDEEAEAVQQPTDQAGRHHSISR